MCACFMAKQSINLVCLWTFVSVLSMPVLCYGILTAELQLLYEIPIAKDSGNETGLIKAFSGDRMPLKQTKRVSFSQFLHGKKIGLEWKGGNGKNEGGQLS